MKKRFLSILIPAIGLLLGTQANAQIKGLFEKEEPVFNASILPTAERGTVKLVYYFTHSKASSIETSFWLRDEGSGMSGNGGNVLIRGLKEAYNRQQDTITITGLQEQHFYTFGVDYRSPGFISSKFETAILKSGYRYNADPEVANTNEAVMQQPASAPCQNPDLFVQVKSSGYCGNEDRPAIQIQCMNCEGKAWEFDVQLRTATTGWISLRADGTSQAASGGGIRIEPLCTLEPGTYYVRVLAKGANCTTPITHNVSSFVTIADRNYNSNPVMQERSVSSVVTPEIEKDIPTLPDTCEVRAQATVQGKVLKGTLQLANNSTCGAFYPYAIVHYVHPGHRDVATRPIALIAGASVPFEISLDDRDLGRNIHTMQVVAYARQNPNAEGIPMSAFWMKANDGTALANNNKVGSNTNVPAPATNPGTTNQSGTSTQQSQTPMQQYETRNPNTSTSTQMNPPANTNEVAYEDISLTEEFQTINVKATDLNCNQIQDLNVVFFSTQQGQADRPLYITWMNPRCCQEDGCKYTVWAGENPDRLRILVEGSKRGVFIRELLQDLLSTDTYIEVSVKTSSGNRKAAYVLGKGALYGIEALADYRDSYRPQESDAFVAQVDGKSQMAIKGDTKMPPTTEPQPMDNPMVGGDLSKRAPTSTVAYEKAQRDVTKFSPCKYAREVLVVGDRPAAQGNQVKIQYDFSDKEYRYTLYLQPENSTEWFVAPGTKEMQENPVFNLNITPQHAGKYAILVHKAASNWGCLAMPLDQAVEIKVSK